MSPVERAVDAMNASLRREYKRILHRLKTDPETLESRHAIGLIIGAIKGEPDTYGKQAVRLLAAALGRDEATLYRFAQVASRWSAADFTHWRERGEATNHPLSWWHFVEASAVSRRRAREELLRRVVEDGLSVRTLARLVEKSRRPYGTGSRFLREAESLIHRTRLLRQSWENVRGASPDEVRQITSRELIDRAKQLHAELVVQAQRALESIETLSTEIHLDDPQS